MFGLEIVLIVFAVSLLASLYLWIRVSGKNKFRASRAKFQAQMNRLDSASLDPKMLVLEYDKLLGAVLQEKYNSRENLGQILKIKAKNFDAPSLNQVWSAHKLRNRIAHEMNFQPNNQEVSQAVYGFKRFISRVLN